MTTTYHTAITTGAAANAATFNAPLATLDAELVSLNTDVGTLASLTTTAKSNLVAAINEAHGEITTARDSYASLDARLDSMVVAGGNIATLTNGAANAGQKVVDVDSTTGFIAGAYVAYTLVGGAIEYNTIDAVTSSTRLTMDTNVGTGGIANDTYISMISPSEVAAAQAINHAGDLTLAQTMEYAAGGVYNVSAYGALAGTASDATAIQAALTAAGASGRGTVKFVDGNTYLVDAKLTIPSGVTLDGNNATIKAHTDLAAPFNVAMVADGATDVTIRNLTFDGNFTTHGWNNNAYLISLGNNCARVRIESCTFVDCITMAVHCQTGAGDEVADVIFTNNNVVSSEGGGISLFGNVTGCVISNNHFTACKDDPIALQGVVSTSQRPVDCTVTGNVIVNCDTQNSTSSTPHGILIAGCDLVTVANNVVRHTYSCGILVSELYAKSSRIAITGNSIYEAGVTGSLPTPLDGIALISAYDVSITGNTVIASKTGGIALATCDRVSITGNTIAGSDGAGVYVGDSQDWVVSGNIITDGAVDAIQILAVSVDCKNGVVANNRVGNSALAGFSNTQPYAVLFSEAGSGTEINNITFVGNDFSGNGTGISEGAATGPIIWRLNVGLTDYQTGAGSPAGAVVPEFIGQDFWDSSGSKWYKAKGLTNSDWILLN